MATKLERLAEKEAELIEKLKELRKQKTRVASGENEAKKRAEDKEDYVVGRILRKIVVAGTDRNNELHQLGFPIYMKLANYKPFVSEREKKVIEKSEFWSHAFGFDDVDGPTT